MAKIEIKATEEVIETEEKEEVVTKGISEVDKKKDEKESKETAKELKKNLVRIKIPVDPRNKEDIVVPVMINGYVWQIKRGETVDVPEEVANILENAKYI